MPIKINIKAFLVTSRRCASSLRLVAIEIRTEMPLYLKSHVSRWLSLYGLAILMLFIIGSCISLPRVSPAPDRGFAPHAGDSSRQVEEIVEAKDLKKDPFGQEAMENALIMEINRQRGEYGLMPLQLAPELAAAARIHSLDMAAYDFAGHKGSNGRNGGDRMISMGYGWRAWGETVGCGSDGDPVQMVQLWMNSSSHRDTLLSSNFHDVGAGYVYRPSGKYQFYWTAAFGARKSAS
jgi:uncharacterized protein YkwD